MLGLVFLFLGHLERKKERNKPSYCGMVKERGEVKERGAVKEHYSIPSVAPEFKQCFCHNNNVINGFNDKDNYISKSLKTPNKETPILTIYAIIFLG